MYSIHPKAATAAKSPFFKRPESSNTSASSTGSEQGHQGLKNMNECDQKVLTEGLEERKAFAEQQNFAFALSSPEIRQRRGRNNSGGSPNLSHHSTSPSSWTSPSETSDHDDCSNSMAVILKHDPESGGDNIEVSIDADDEASFLHSVCRNASRVTDLQIAIGHVTVDAASLADQHGQTPLHVLSMNKTLAQTTTSVHHMGLLSGQSSSSKILYSPTSLQRAYSHGSSTTAASMSTEQAKSDESALASFIVDVLFRAYPAAMISTDANGFIPFESSLHEWVESCYALAQSRPNSSTRSLNTSENQLSTLLPTLWDLKDTVASRWATATGQGYQHQNNSKNSLVRGGLQSQDSLDIEQGFTGVTEGMQSRQQIFPNNVRVSAHMLSSLHMLSALLDALDTISEQLAETGIRETTSSSRRRSKRAVDALNNITIQDISTSIVETVASIPDLVKTILFIGNDEQKNHCIGTTLMQRVLRCKESVGGWLTGMLQSHKKKPSNLAIEYLHIISSSSVANPERESSEIDSRINGLGRHPPSEEMNDFCQAISQLPDFVPSLLSLGDRQMEDAATTKVVQKVLDLFISRPFVVTVVFCDALFLSVLIGGYRGAVSGLLLGASPSAVLRYIYLANVGIFYFVIRETGKAISLCMITGRARVYFLSFWNLSDMLSTILSLTSLIIIRSTMESPDYGMIRNICTVTTGLLWLRVLSFLKGINIMLATFVLAIIQISRDILWFCVILFTFVVSFAQMFFTLLAPSTCMEENVNTKDCTPSEYYLRVYAILLGDFGLFNRESFFSVFSVCLVVLYTFMVVLVLLNVLIAVASDSYEKCLIRSRNLFGRARTMMVAEMVSFQNLLKRNTVDETAESAVYATWWSSDSWAQGWSRGSVVFCGFSSFVVAMWTLAEVLGHLVGVQHGNIWMSLGSVCVNVVLFVCMMLVLSVGASTERTEARFCSEWYGRHFQRAMLRLLGTSGDNTDADFDWNGRLLYMRNAMEKLNATNKDECRSLIKVLESKMQHSETHLKSELSSIEQILSNLQAERMETKTEMRETLAEILQTIQSRAKQRY